MEFASTKRRFAGNSGHPDSKSMTLMTLECSLVADLQMRTWVTGLNRKKHRSSTCRIGFSDFTGRKVFNCPSKYFQPTGQGWQSQRDSDRPLPPNGARRLIKTGRVYGLCSELPFLPPVTRPTAISQLRWMRVSSLGGMKGSMPSTSHRERLLRLGERAHVILKLLLKLNDALHQFSIGCH